MAIDDAEGSPSRELEEGTAERTGEEPSADRVAVGEYTWDDYLREYGFGEEADLLYERFETAPGGDRWGEEDRTLTDEDWERAGLNPADFLGFHPDELPGRFAAIGAVAKELESRSKLIGYDDTPVVKDIYGWEDYKREYFYDGNGDPPPSSTGDAEPFDPSDDLGFDPEATEEVLSHLGDRAEELDALIDERTVDVAEELDEDSFFSDEHGATTVVNRYDLEKAVPIEKKRHFREEERYWVNEPYAFVILFHSRKENEKKYYVIEPYRNEIEEDLIDYVTGKLRTSIKYADEGTVSADEDRRRDVIEEQTYELLERYDLYEREQGGGLGNQLARTLDIDNTDGVGGRFLDLLGYEEIEQRPDMEGIAARPEPAVLETDSETLNEYQVEKLLYYLQRDFIGYERIDGIKHDINVEDISCDGYDSPVFVYHSDYEQIITNVYHGQEELDDFVVKLAQRSGKGISKRQPQVDATLPDGSRAQLTLGKEVSDHGTNYTIRQFQEVPHTPIDLINWNTFSLDEMGFLWLCIENDKSLIFAGGTASGKTTSLNAVSLFIPSNSKIVSIEDTREVELPQRNWVASVTRPSFTDDDKGDVDEFDLLEAALRQRPDYIVMGEIRGEEGRTLFQVMSTGHTTYTTFHADSVGEVLKRFTTDPINVSKTMFTALDLVSIQTATRVQGHKVRRNKVLTEINHYDPENDEINVRDVYQWQAETDEFLKMGASNTLEDVMFDRGWDRDRLDEEILKRRAVLAYLIVNGLNTYTEVAATLQAFINDPETILGLIANENLEESLEDLREMESVLIDVDPQTEAMVPRPSPSEELLEEANGVLDEAEYIFERFRGEEHGDVVDALGGIAAETDVEAQAGAGSDLELDSGVADPVGPDVTRDAGAVSLESGEESVDGLEAGDETPKLDDIGDPSELDEPETPALPGDSAPAGTETADGSDDKEDELDIDNWGFGEVEGEEGRD